MSLRNRLLIVFTLLIAVAATLGSREFLQEFRRGYAELVEGLMYDFSSSLATQVERDASAQGGTLHPEKIAEIYQRIRGRSEGRRAAGKTDPIFNIYAVDSTGRVLFSSRDPEEVGRDYSRWNDVFLTLRGKYGSRSTRMNVTDPLSSVYYVSAPIFSGDRIVGAITAIQPEWGVGPIMSRIIRRITPLLIIGAVTLLILGFLVMRWITGPLHRLRDYALAVSQGRKAPAPEMSSPELRNLLEAFETMRTSLEGKKTIEEFVQGLTHEMKSPLTAIRGSAELCLEPIPEDRRRDFLRTIESETARLQVLLEELLRLAKLSQLRNLERIENVELPALIHSLMAALASSVEKRNLRLEFDFPEDGELRISGDRLLIEQAIRNVAVNAIDFSPPSGMVRFTIRRSGRNVIVGVEDEGPGVPNYAQTRIFEKFYSLARPSGSERPGAKSTGLGLNFVREVMKLHQGSVTLVDSDRGAHFQLSFPTEAEF
jgi:two-component system sensor histidine kinase CreC